jgi:hypothetical protein
MICRRFLPAGALLVCVLISACGRDEPDASRSSIAVTGPSAGAPASGLAYPSAALDPAGVIAFPPRNESFTFRNELEASTSKATSCGPRSTCGTA